MTMRQPDKTSALAYRLGFAGLIGGPVLLLWIFPPQIEFNPALTSNLIYWLGWLFWLCFTAGGAAILGMNLGQAISDRKN